MEQKSATLEFFDQILSRAIEMGSSDIIVKSNQAPSIRIDGKLSKVMPDVLTQKQILEFIDCTIPHNAFQKWTSDSQVDYSYPLPDGHGAFRINAFYQLGMPSIVFRYIVGTPPTFQDLSLDPALMEKIANFNSGIALICGPTGSGKSSTLAALIDYINETKQKHIITLEDPVEFIHKDKKSVISQREIGIDSPNFSTGLKSALRQDPDIILLGEMRDSESFEIALQAAETGHLVLSTLHAHNPRQAIERLVDFFPESEFTNRCRQVASSVKAVLCQQLLPKKGCDGRVPATSAFFVEDIAKTIIHKGEFVKVQDLLDADSATGSRSLNKDLYRLIRLGLVTKDDALAISNNPKGLDMLLKGIKLNRGQILG